jgi:hypothetical protein
MNETNQVPHSGSYDLYGMMEAENTTELISKTTSLKICDILCGSKDNRPTLSMLSLRKIFFVWYSVFILTHF